MKILAVETCLGACSAALVDGNGKREICWEPMERGHAEALAPMVQQVMRGHDFASLDRLAVSTGPGTFTGQRVGLSFMRGLRLALNKPLLGVTSLEAMAAEASDAHCGEPRIAAIHDARRDEAYLALFENGVTILSPRVLPFSAAVEAIRAFGPCLLTGTGQGAALEKLGKGFLSTMIEQPSAFFVATLAAEMP